MRLCSFVPFNVPILAGMLLSAPTVANTIFWQVANQSYNAGLNYGNRNASSNYTFDDLKKAYVYAVGSSLIVGVSLRKMLAGVTSRASGGRLLIVNSFVSILAAGSAGSLNTYFIRRVEIENGIEVFEDEVLSKPVGVSCVAAKNAVAETAASRVFLSGTCLLAPAIFFSVLEKFNKIPKNPRMKLPFEMTFFLIVIMTMLPASVALFPQTKSISVDRLEKDLAKDLTGKGTKFVYFNKGL